MKRKYDHHQVGIRVKNMESKKHIQYLPQSNISQPFSLTLSHYHSNQQQSISHLSDTVSLDLVLQVENLNKEIGEIASAIKNKQTIIQQLQKKLKNQEIYHNKKQIELKSIIEIKNNQIKSKDQEINRKNQEINHYRAQLNLHIEDIRTQNKQMIVHLIKQLQREKEGKQLSEALEQERALRSMEQNSILQRQIQQNSFLQKQLEQTTMIHRHQSPRILTQNTLSHSPSIKRTKIQKPQIPSSNFRPLSQIVNMNTMIDLHESLKMMSPLTLNIQQLQPRQRCRVRPKYLRKDELQNKYFQY